MSRNFGLSNQPRRKGCRSEFANSIDEMLLAPASPRFAMWTIMAMVVAIVAVGIFVV